MKRVIPALFAVLVLGGTGIGAQDLSQADIEPIQHRVTVTLKLIQVFVTDAKGKSALDLGKTDFLVYDNGRPQTITDFERHVLAAPEAERVEPAPAPSAAREASAPLLSRKFIFFVDYGRNDFEGLAKAKKAAVEFLDSKVQKDDEVALFSFSTAGGLTLHEYLTSDHAKVKSAINKMRDIPGILEPGMSSVSTDHEPLGMELLSAQVFSPHGGHAGVGGTRHLFADVAEWAKALRAIPGQKNIIFFSRGFGATVLRRGGDVSNTLFQTMARALASANAPVFSVNTTTGFAAKVAAGVFSEQSLDYLSQTTGGKYMGGVDYSRRIAADIQDATSNFYVLGYYVAEAWDGKYHNLKVEVRKPGFTVHAQKGYFNPRPFAKLSPVEKHLHLLGVALAETASAKRNQNFSVTAVQFAGAPGANALLLSEIPLAFRESIGDRVEFISLILDQNKAIVDGKKVEIDWADFRTGKIYQYTTAALTPGRYDCRAVVRNLDDGRAAAGASSLEVAAVPAEGPVVFPPFFLVRGAGAGYLNVAAPAGKAGAADVALSTIFPFPAGEYVPLVGGLESGADSVHAVLKCVWREMRGGDVELTARLTAEDAGEKVPIPTDVLSAASRDEADFYFLRFELPGLPPGRYRLEIVAGDRKTGLTARTAGWLLIR